MPDIVVKQHIDNFLVTNTIQEAQNALGIPNFPLTANWTNASTTVIANSGDWGFGGDSYTAVSSNSAKWGLGYEGYTSVLNTSANWNKGYSAYTALTSSSANWDNTYTAVTTTSSNWNKGYSGYTSITGVSASWNSTFATVFASSAVWNGGTSLSTLTATSANWDKGYNGYTALTATSGNWNKGYSAYSSMTASSGLWNSVHSTVLNASANWNTSYALLTSLSSNSVVLSILTGASANWNTSYALLTALSGRWNTSYSVLTATSGNWNLGYSAYTSMTASSGLWNSVHSTVLNTSANWNASYSVLTATSGNWNRGYNGYTALTATSGNWDKGYNGYTALTATSGNWDRGYSAYTAMTATSSSWNTARTFVNHTSSARFDSMYRTRARWTGVKNYNTNSDQIRFCTFGDSYATAPSTWLKANLGNGGDLYEMQSATLTNGASLVNRVTPDPYTTDFNYISLPTGGIARYGPDSSIPATNLVMVYYVARSGGGTFKLQVDSNANGTWLDIGTTIDTNNSDVDTITRYSLNIASLGLHFTGAQAQAFRVRAVGVSGTCRLLHGGVVMNDLVNQRANGAVGMDIAQGGTTPDQWDGVSQDFFTQLLGPYDPHIIFVCAAETLVAWQTWWPSVYTKMRTAAPNADFVFIGSHPTTNDTNPLSNEASDTYLREFAAANNETFVETRRFFPPWQRDDTVGQAIYADGVHLNTAGNEIKLNLIADELQWFATAINRSSGRTGAAGTTLTLTTGMTGSAPSIIFQNFADSNTSYQGGRRLQLFNTIDQPGEARLAFVNQNSEIGALFGNYGFAATRGFGMLGTGQTVRATVPRGAVDALNFYGPAMVTSINSTAVPAVIHEWRFGTTATAAGTIVGVMTPPGEIRLNNGVGIREDGTAPWGGSATLAGGTAFIATTKSDITARNRGFVNYRHRPNVNTGFLSLCSSNQGEEKGVRIYSTNASDNNVVDWILFNGWTGAINQNF